MSCIDGLPADEIHFDTSDSLRVFRPDFRLSVTIKAGSPTYWVTATVGGRRSSVGVFVPDERTQEISAELFRNLTTMLLASELNQLREMFREALDGNIEDTICNQLSKIADRVGAQ